jgi:hypothetical protein
MVREQIKVEDFDRVGRQYEYFIWNFVSKNQNVNWPTIRPIFDFDETHYKSPNFLIPLLEVFNVPYFETYIEDSIDFLSNLGVPLDSLYLREVEWFKPFILSFNRKRMVNSTYNGFCYCPEGITKLLIDLNPDIVLNVNLD